VIDTIPTRIVHLEPWLEVSNVEACFSTVDQGVLIIKDQGQTLLDESLSVVRFQGRPEAEGFWTTHAQRMPNGGYALATARSGMGDKNLQLFDASARFITSFAIGDGIEHMLVDPRSQIWVGYFDEGIFGGDLFSSRGVSRFDQQGNLQYQWDYVPLGPIFDCDALTLDEAGAAWICPYNSYFVAKIEDTTAQLVLPKSPVSILSGLLIDATHLGFLGGIDYHGFENQNGVIFHPSPDGGWVETLPQVGPDPVDKESIVTLISLRTGERIQVQVLDENSRPIGFRGRASCRAGTAVCWTDESIYRFSLASLFTV
jgi:hypothetical protein